MDDRPTYRQLQHLDGTDADGLWIVDDTWRRSPMDRRMTIMGLRDGRLAVHNGILLDDDGMRRIDGLGQVSLILVPNLFHGSEAGRWAERYPTAKLFVPREAARRLRKRGRYPRIDGTFEDDWPADELAGVLRCQPLGGMRLHEAVFLHVATRTLVLTDLCMNLPDRYRGLVGLLLRWNGIVDRFAASKLARWWFFDDKKALARSLRPVLDGWDFDRVIINHGRILETGGQQRLREAFAFLPDA